MLLSPCFSAFCSDEQPFSQPALLGLHVSWGLRQSIPSSMYAICAAEIETAPSFAEGQTNFPRSRRFAYSDNPIPSCQRTFASLLGDL